VIGIVVVVVGVGGVEVEVVSELESGDAVDFEDARDDKSVKDVSMNEDSTDLPRQTGIDTPEHSTAYVFVPSLCGLDLDPVSYPYTPTEDLLQGTSWHSGEASILAYRIGCLDSDSGCRSG
jgi:hypothetical protein